MVTMDQKLKLVLYLTNYLTVFKTQITFSVATGTDDYIETFFLMVRHSKIKPVD